MIDPDIILFARVSICLLFAHAVWNKLQSFPHFRATLAEYQLLPTGLVTPAAAMVIACECAIVLLLCVNATEFLGFSLAAGLLAVYLSAIWLNLLRGRRDIDCGCTGPGHTQALTYWLLLRNLILVLIAVFGLLPATGRVIGWGDALLVLVAVLLATVLYATANQLLSNEPRLDALDGYMDGH